MTTTLHATEQARPQRTWSDEATPIGRASRRRWVLAFVVLLGLFTAGMTTSEDIGGHWGLGGFITLVVVVGTLKRSTRRVISLAHSELDERDRAARDRAFRLSYPLFLLVLAGTALVCFLTAPRRPTGSVRLPDGTRITSTEPWGIALTGSEAFGIALALILLAAYLPTAVLAWREPSPPVPEPGEPRAVLGERGRDTLLALAVAVSFVLGAVANTAVASIVPLLVAGMIVRAAARRGAGGIA